MTSEAATPTDTGFACEQIDVVRIKLSRPGGSAVVSELRSADLLLAKWAENGLNERTLSFEVTFMDGYAFCGRYVYEKSKKSRPSLSRLVRLVFEGLKQVPAALPDGTSFLTAPTADLARYGIHGQ